MKPIEFAETNVTMGQGQKEYLPLPAHKDSEGIITFCWKLTWRERVQILLKGCFWNQVMTFNMPLQPQRPNINKPVLRHD